MCGAQASRLFAKRPSFCWSISWNRCGSCGSTKPPPFADGRTSSDVVTAEILPRHRGVLVKSLGDGLMARFETVPDAVDAAAGMHRALATQNASFPEDQQFHLRAGINAAMAWSDGHRHLRNGVNLAARLATLAGPGETIASASAHEQLAAALASLARPGETIGSATARDELTHGVDASCEDLGECILKHFDKPVRAYRVGPASAHQASPRGTTMERRCSRPLP